MIWVLEADYLSLTDKPPAMCLGSPRILATSPGEVGLACENRFEILSLFAASVNSPFYHDTFTPFDDGSDIQEWPYDPWDYARPLP